MANQYVEIKSLRRPVLKKCEMCDKVQDIYYKALFNDFETNGFLVGEISLCRPCGQNLDKILGNDTENLDTVVMKEFTFTK